MPSARARIEVRASETERNRRGFVQATCRRDMSFCRVRKLWIFFFFPSRVLRSTFEIDICLLYSKSYFTFSNGLTSKNSCLFVVRVKLYNWYYITDLFFDKILIGQVKCPFHLCEDDENLSRQNMRQIIKSKIKDQKKIGDSSKYLLPIYPKFEIII